MVAGSRPLRLFWFGNLLRRRTIPSCSEWWPAGVCCYCKAYWKSISEERHSTAASLLGPSIEEVMLRLLQTADRNLFESELLWFLKKISKQPRTCFGIYAHAAEFLVMSCKHWRNSSTDLNVDSCGMYFSATRYSMKWHSSSDSKILNALHRLFGWPTSFCCPDSSFVLMM